MIKKIFLLILLNFLNLLFAQGSPQLFPLEVGNFWIYADPTANGNPRFKHEIIDSSYEINNNTYFKVTAFFLPGGSMSTEYVRKNNDGFFVSYTPGDDYEIIYFKEKIKFGDHWNQFIFGHNIYSTISDTGRFSIFGINTKYYDNYVTDSVDYGSRYIYKFSNDFGLLEWKDITIGSTFKLLGCRINGIIYGDTTFFSLVSVDDIEEDIPLTFSLNQNFPNPFNPNTEINYSISQNGFVQLKVFDILGREVANLVNKEQTMGNYKVEFNASNLTSGIYFYRMQSGSFTETKKLILLR